MDSIFRPVVGTLRAPRNRNVRAMVFGQTFCPDLKFGPFVAFFHPHDPNMFALCSHCIS
jgi:hypothetical protein